MSEGINAEHLDVFVSYDPELVDVRRTCNRFSHLTKHKLRPMIMGPKMKVLLDTHSFQSHCVRALTNLVLYGLDGSSANFTYGRGTETSPTTLLH